MKGMIFMNNGRPRQADDSGLQTPQPDQPLPTEAERQENDTTRVTETTEKTEVTREVVDE